MKHDYDKEISHLKKQINALEQENKKLLDTLIRHSKGDDTIKQKETFEPGSAQAIFRSSQARTKWNKPVGQTQT